MDIRPVKKLSKARPTLEGAGVHLNRAFGFGGGERDFDPFLLLDDFRSDVPADYLAGFPWHPHRGMETITYVLAGTVEHGDSLGHRGIIRAGDVQWMTAGSGIIHQEMPKGDPTGRMHGFQLWANLPGELKMTSPHYQEIKAADIPVANHDGTEVRVVCGDFLGTKGPISGVAAHPLYLDVSVPPGERANIPVPAGHNAFAYVFAGSGRFCNIARPLSVPTESLRWLDTTPFAEADNRTLVLFGDGDTVAVEAGVEEGVRFLLAAGEPIDEPIAWYGPIVMNTQAELRTAFDELDRGTFLTDKR